MRTPIFVRPLTNAKQQILRTGLRSPDAFVLRRCQMLLASAWGERAPQIAQHWGCDDQTVLDALHAFNAHGLEALERGSSRPQTTHPAFTLGGLDRGGARQQRIRGAVPFSHRGEGLLAHRCKNLTPPANHPC